MSVIYNFNEQLELSNRCQDLPVWESIYRKAFPDFAAMIKHPKDGWHQRAGIDRSVILNNSKRILIDEKNRFRNRKTGKVYEDIALEYWSNMERKSPGWVCKPLICDYIGYAIIPIGKCYLLPVIQLQQAWKIHGESWKRAYPNILTPNEGWTTQSVGVPPHVLFPAIGAFLRIEFEPMEEDEPGTELRLTNAT
jgi:hypothetical protein